MRWKEFVEKYGIVLMLLGIAVIFVILKLIGFPEILY
jgi:hypothetical protein